jgi:hypothetical protein
LGIAPPAGVGGDFVVATLDRIFRGRFFVIPVVVRS